MKKTIDVLEHYAKNAIPERMKELTRAITVCREYDNIEGIEKKYKELKERCSSPFLIQGVMDKEMCKGTTGYYHTDLQSRAVSEWLMEEK